MDDDRYHSSASRNTTYSSRANRTGTGRQLDWDAYRNRLIANNINQNAQTWYGVRVEAFLKAHGNTPISALKGEHVSKYLHVLSETRTLAEWQVLQAIDAIRILCTEVLDGRQFRGVVWDDFTLKTKTINASHATLAREAVGTGGGDRCHFNAHKGVLAVVYTEFQDELVRLKNELRARQYSIRTEQAYEQRLLGELDGTAWLIAALLYGAGLRLMECVRLRVMDVDFGSGQIVVRNGKGANVESGYDIRTVQELLGHADVSTTMIYTHVLNRPGFSVRSPLD